MKSFIITLAILTGQTHDFKLYPNPVTDGVFYIESKKENTKQIELYDMLGKKVLKLFSNSAKDTIKVSHLKSGVYVVKITEVDKIYTRKIVIK